MLVMKSEFSAWYAVNYFLSANNTEVTIDSEMVEFRL